MTVANIDDERGRRPVRRSVKMAESVAHEIVRRICANNLTEGSQLPSEAEMLEEFGVGRGSLREALRILEVHGLISMKSGRHGGPVVATVSTQDFGRMSALYFQVGGMTLQELIEARISLEPLLAGKAARHAAEEPKMCRELLAAAKSTRLDDDAAYLSTSTGFHTLVGRMAGNSILFLLTHSLGALFHERFTTMLFPPERRPQVASDHDAIAQAICHGEVQQAEAAMREHVERYTEYVAAQHPELLHEVVDWR